MGSEGTAIEITAIIALAVARTTLAVSVELAKMVAAARLETWDLHHKRKETPRTLLLPSLVRARNSKTGTATATATIPLAAEGELDSAHSRQIRRP